MRILLDANAVLRHLLNDIPAQADQTSEAIQAGAEVTPEVIAECVYVLTGVYELPRSVTSDALIRFLEEVSCERDRILTKALQLFADTKFDFVDCILLASNQLTGQPVLTFDKKLRTATQGTVPCVEVVRSDAGRG